MAKAKPAADAAESEPMDGADTVHAAPAIGVVVTQFDGVPDGLVYPRTYAPGDEVEGDLGAVALREGWAEPKV